MTRNIFFLFNWCAFINYLKQGLVPKKKKVETKGKSDTALHIQLHYNVVVKIPKGHCQLN